MSNCNFIPDKMETMEPRVRKRLKRKLQNENNHPNKIHRGQMTSAEDQTEGINAVTHNFTHNRKIAETELIKKNIMSKRRLRPRSSTLPAQVAH